MIRLLAGAILAAAATGLILYQFQGTAELAVWEVLLLVVVFFQYRRIPNRGDPLSKPLFALPRYDPPRLPREVASTELSVIDATTGYVIPDRRLRPLLQTIAEHRLGRHGLGLGSNDARSRFSEDGWNVLMNEGDESVRLDALETLVTDMEKL